MNSVNLERRIELLEKIENIREIIECALIVAIALVAILLIVLIIIPSYNDMKKKEKDGTVKFVLSIILSMIVIVGLAAVYVYFVSGFIGRFI